MSDKPVVSMPVDDDVSPIYATRPWLVDEPICLSVLKYDIYIKEDDQCK